MRRTEYKVILPLANEKSKLLLWAEGDNFFMFNTKKHEQFLNTYTNGIHLYLNIKNFDSLVKNDEADNDVSRIIHFLNAFVSTLERFVSDKYRDNVYFEKLTGSRIHLIIYGGKDIQPKIFLSVSFFAAMIAKRMMDISKYKSIPNVAIQIGADYGYFFGYEFSQGDYSEYTSIGYSANIGCKLQCLAKQNEIVFSNEIKSLMPIADRLFSTLDDERQKSISKKYPNCKAYTISSVSLASTYKTLSDNNLFLNFKLDDIDSYYDYANQIANKTNITDMDVIAPKKLYFSNWNVSKSAYIENAIVVYADVRGFTKQFNKDDSNLLSMAFKTKTILSQMFDECDAYDGSHVQFQGDRECALFPPKHEKEAVLFALKLQQEINEKVQNVGIGIGINKGKVFATQIGLNSETFSLQKQNIILGKTVIECNRLEDSEASVGETVISSNAYQSLPQLVQKLFKPRNNYWFTNKKFSDYMSLAERDIVNENNSIGSFKPWREKQ